MQKRVVYDSPCFLTFIQSKVNSSSNNPCDFSGPGAFGPLNDVKL